MVYSSIHYFIVHCCLRLSASDMAAFFHFIKRQSSMKLNRDCPLLRTFICTLQTVSEVAPSNRIIKVTYFVTPGERKLVCALERSGCSTLTPPRFSPLCSAHVLGAFIVTAKRRRHSTLGGRDSGSGTQSSFAVSMSTSLPHQELKKKFIF